MWWWWCDGKSLSGCVQQILPWATQHDLYHCAHRSYLRQFCNFLFLFFAATNGRIFRYNRTAHCPPGVGGQWCLRRRFRTRRVDDGRRSRHDAQDVCGMHTSKVVNFEFWKSKMLFCACVLCVVFGEGGLLVNWDCNCVGLCVVFILSLGCLSRCAIWHSSIREYLSILCIDTWAM